MSTGLLRQSSYGSLTSTAASSKTCLKRSSSLSSIVSGTSELGYSVAPRSSLQSSGSSASAIKASMLGGRRPSAVMPTSGAAGSRITAFGGAVGTQESAKRSSIDLGSLRSLKGTGLLDTCTAGDLAALRRLVEGGPSKPDVNSSDSQGKSALMLAVTSGSKAVVEYLLAKRADVNAVDGTEKTALHHTSKRARNRRTAQALAGAEQAEVVGLLLRVRACLEARDSNGCTPLMLAVANSDESVAQTLLQAGASLATTDSEGQTCMDFAVSFELTAMANLLRNAEELRKQRPPTAAPAAGPVPAAAVHLEPASGARQAAASPPAAATPAPEAVAPAAAALLAEADEAAAGESGRRSKADKAEKKKKKHAKEAEVHEAPAVEPSEAEADAAAATAATGTAAMEAAAQQAAQEAAAKEAAERTKREAEEKAAKEEKRRVQEEAKRKAEDAKRAAEELARKEAEERDRALSRLQHLMESNATPLIEVDLEEVLKELKAAIKAAQAAGVEEQKISEAESLIKDLKSRGKAQEKLKQAMADRSLDKLRKAIAKAEEANVAKSYLDDAKAVLAEEEPRQKVREQLQAAKESGKLEELRAALAAAGKTGLDEAEMGPYRKLQAVLEKREEVEATLREAVESRSINALRAAIQEAIEAGLDSKLIRQAEKVLKEEEPKQKARELLEEACIEGTVLALKKAIQTAEEAKLDASEYTQAVELLRQEEEKMRALECVNRTLEAVQAVDMTDIDALREAKERLGASIQGATKVNVGESLLLDAEKRRKRLHNSIEDLKGSIRVFCRIRPLSTKEQEQGDTMITEAVGSMSLKVDGGDAGNSSYAFDAVFTPGTQEEVFEDCRDLVQSAADGYNVTMFAYGQTGAGKTFTMYGAPGLEGTAPRTIKEIYRVIEEGQSRFDYEVRGAMLELYRNDLVDLLSKGQVVASKSKLSIKTEKSGTVIVDGLTDEECKSAEDLSALLERGNQQRTVASTAMNSESSRSHLVLIIKIRSVNKQTKEQLQGKILICDLAGSERLKKSQATEENQKEAIEINKSLTALGDVIEALTKGEKKVVPYRNHKLTQLMQDSLGGTSKTLMFVNCSPANSNLDETVMSLKYATRAKKITNTATKKS